MRSPSSSGPNSRRGSNVRFPFGKRARADDDFAAEIESHLAIETERLVRSGMSPAEARFAARRAFGNPTTAAERFHESRRAAWLEQLLQHVGRAARRLLRAPA